MLFEKCFVQSLLLAEILTSTLFCSSQLFNQSAFDLYSHQKGTWQTSGWHLPTTISYTVWLGYTLQAFWCFCVVKFPQSQRSAQTETYLIMLFYYKPKFHILHKHLFIYSGLLSTYPLSHIHWNSNEYTESGEFGVQYFAQQYFNMLTGAAGGCCTINATVVWWLPFSSSSVSSPMCSVLCLPHIAHAQIN